MSQSIASVETRREHQVRSMLNRAAEYRESKPHRFTLRLFQNSAVTVDDHIVFLKSILEWVRRDVKDTQLGKDLLPKVQPANAAPLGVEPQCTRWSAEHLSRWLRFAPEAKASDQGMYHILRGFADFVGRRLALPDSNAVASTVFSEHATLHEAATALVALVTESAVPIWSNPFGYVSRVDPSFTTEPASFDVDALSEIADEVIGHLAQKNGPRVAVVLGDTHSGKKVVLRHFVKKLAANQTIRLQNKVHIPVLALALDDHGPRSFVDEVYRFFAGARYRQAEVESNVASLDQREKISRIVALARIVPSCVVLADIAGIEEDEVVRSIAGSPVGEIIAALLDGHPFTRVAFTAKPGSSLGSAALDAALKCAHQREFRVPAALELQRVMRVLNIDFNSPRADQTVGGLTARLAQIALRFQSDPSSADRKRYEDACIAALCKDEPALLVEFICRRLLNDDQFRLVGLIASSHDGLRASVLERILREMKRLDKTDAVFQHDWRALLGGCGELVQQRHFPGDPQLGDGAGAAPEDLFAIDDGWRPHVLRLWWEHDRVAARNAHWLIAREATDQARVLRHSRTEGRFDVSFGRDVQALNALIASIDTTEILSPQHMVSSAIQASEPLHLSYHETALLPPVRRKVDRPSSASTLRYCYLQLYLNDLDGADFSLLSRKQDATTRLGTLLRFFDPEMPWLRLEQRVLSSELRNYGHLVLTFSPDELMEFLVATAISALRLERYDIVAAAVRLGEHFYNDRNGQGVSKLAYARLLRVEVDAGLLVCGNPDVVLEAARTAAANPTGIRADTSMSDVSARLTSLLNKPFAAAAPGESFTDHLQGRGKLLCKLGETYHVEGRFRAARTCFAEAIAVERSLLADPATRSIAPVFGGKGARSFLRFMLDRARITGRRGRGPTFIFFDELALPAPPLILDSSDVTRAEEIMAMCSRRVSRERIVDAIGFQIDAARLAALQHDFALAYRTVEMAMAARLLSGTSLEVILELNAVRTRYLLDGAVFCLQTHAKQLPFGPGQAFAPVKQVSDIAAHLGLPKEKHPLDVATLLLERARSSLETFGKLVENRRADAVTYRIYRDYLSVLLTAIATRIVPSGDVAAMLAEAHNQLKGVVTLMRDSDFRMHLLEATRLLRGLRAALDHYGAPEPQVETAVILPFPELRSVSKA